MNGIFFSNFFPIVWNFVLGMTIHSDKSSSHIFLNNWRHTRISKLCNRGPLNCYVLQVFRFSYGIWRGFFRNKNLDPQASVVSVSAPTTNSLDKKIQWHSPKLDIFLNSILLLLFTVSLNATTEHPNVALVLLFNFFFSFLCCYIKNTFLCLWKRKIENKKRKVDLEPSSGMFI